MFTFRKNKVSEFLGDTSRKATAGSAALQGGFFCPKGILFCLFPARLCKMGQVLTALFYESGIMAQRPEAQPRQGIAAREWEIVAVF